MDISLDKETRDASEYLEDLFSKYRYASDRKIYVIIDEYDHFANDVLSEDREYFNEITGKDGFVRKFYEVFKEYAGEIVDRIFVTGVTPITMDSLTSGFNISKNLSNVDDLNKMIGFTEEEALCLLRKCGIDEKHIGLIREYYNGYLFNKKAKNKVYNSSLLMYFLLEYTYGNKLPDNLVDPNVISDYTRITQLFDLYEDHRERYAIIESIVSGGGLAGNVQDGIGPLIGNAFGADPSAGADGEARLGFSTDDFISLLYYLGLLTISGASGEGVNLVAPNYCISSVYAKYYLSYLYHRMNSLYTWQEEIRRAMHDVIVSNDLCKFKEVVEKLLREVSNIDYMGFDEKYIKLMMYCVGKNSSMYLVKTEYEIEGRRADLVFLPNYVTSADNYYVFEIKYIKKEEYTEKRLEKEQQDAIRQVREYAANAEEMKNIPNLRKYAVVAVKDELKVFEQV